MSFRASSEDLGAAATDIGSLRGDVVFASASGPDVYHASSNAYGKVSYAYDKASAQVSRLNAKWDDGDWSTGGYEDNRYNPQALGSAGTVTYGFLSDGDIDSAVSGVETPGDHRALNPGEIARVEYAISLLSEVADITFTRVYGANGGPYLSRAGDAEIDIFGEVGSNGGWSSTSRFDGELYASAVNIGTSGLASSGTYAFTTAMHEVAHAIGLSHPGDYDAGDEGAPSYAASADYFEDSRQYTLMSYFGEENTGADFGGRYATGPMLHDIAALQRLYGVNTQTRWDGTIYGFGSNTGDEGWTLTGAGDAMIGAIWDAGGADVIDASGYAADQVIDLREGAFSSLGGLTYNLAIAEGVKIEDAIGGAGDDLLIGNGADVDFVDARWLGANGRPLDGAPVGYTGSNLLLGGAGNDTVSYADARGGLAIDLSDPGGVFDLGIEGIDTIRGVENLIGGAFSDRLGGSTGDNLIDGGGGRDTIFGNGGFDTLLGGTGRDLLDLSGMTEGVHLDLAADRLSDVWDEALGTIASFEDAAGTAFADLLSGTSGTNSLAGGAGDDILVGLDGDDLLFGGAGDDLIFGDGADATT